MKTLIIIPAYNESSNIRNVINNITSNFTQYDYIIINDCSKDNTEEICKENNFNFVSLPVNLGIGGAVQCGYKYALEKNYDIAVQIDGDGQHDPAYIEKIILPIIKKEADMVIGSRFIENKGFQSSFIRRFGIWIIKIFIRICCGAKVTDTTSGFRAANKDLIKLFANEYAHDYPEPEAIVCAVLNGYKVTEAPVIMNERTGGISSINTLRSAYYMLKVPLALLIYRLGIRKIKKRINNNE